MGRRSEPFTAIPRRVCPCLVPFISDAPCSHGCRKNCAALFRPGHYSRLHGLQNFRSEFEGLSAADDGGMTAIIARIKTSLTEPSTAVRR